MKRWRLAGWFACVSIGALLAINCGTVHAPSGDGGGGIDAADDGDGGEETPDANVDAMVDPCAGPSIAFEDFGSCYAITMCEYLLSCSNRIESMDMCMELLVPARLDVQFRRFADAITAGRLHYDGEAAFQCLSALNPESCADFEDQPACQEFFQGLVAPGGLCYDSMECEIRNSRCDDLGCIKQCCPGMCVSPATLGGDCSSASCEPGAHCVGPAASSDYLCYNGEGSAPCNGDWDCDEPFYCNTGTSTCYPDVGGAQCMRDEQCTRPSFCLGDDMPAAVGNCADAAEVGQECDERCEGNLHCTYIPGSDTPGTCQPQPQVGESCAAPDAQCPYNSFCNPVSLECEPRLDLEADCSVNPCRVELLCNTSSVCVERPGFNQPCTSGACAMGFFCSTEITGNPTGVCWEAQPSGAACERYTHCQSFICAANDGGTYVCQDYEVCGG